MSRGWTSEIEERFTQLRLRELDGELTETERGELVEIRAMVAVVEAELTSPGLARLEAEQVALQGELERLATENEGLSRLIEQQASLIVDTKRWLAEFERRYAGIRGAYTKLQQRPLTT